jgi:hypothetical protein
MEITKGAAMSYRDDFLAAGREAYLAIYRFLNEQSCPITSLVASILGAILVFCGLWFMQCSGHFLLGGLLILAGLCCFVYGLSSTFDFIELRSLVILGSF